MNATTVATLDARPSKIAFSRVSGFLLVDFRNTADRYTLLLMLPIRSKK